MSTIRPDDPGYLMVHAMCLGSSALRHETRCLEELLECRPEEIDLPKLGEALVEQGWLAPTDDNVRCARTIGSGDVGYVKEDGNFDVVSNVHNFLQSVSGPLTWAVNFTPLMTTTPVRVSQSGCTYQGL